MDQASVKKSAWLRRRVHVVAEGIDMNEIVTHKINEHDNCADVGTKYLVFATWSHLEHYINNLAGDPPP